MNPIPDYFSLDEEPSEDRKAAAFKSMVAQVNLREWQKDDWYGISLSEMWRAAGCPEGSSPAVWATIHPHSMIFTGLSGSIQAIYPNLLWSYGK